MKVDHLFSLPAGRLLKRTARVAAALALAGCATPHADKKHAPVATVAGKQTASRQTISVQTWFIELKTDTPAAQALVAKLEEKTGMKKIGGNTGILSATQAKAIWAEVKALGQFEILSAPTVSVASGNQANISVGEEMRYPARWEPNATKTEWMPMDYETRLVGVESEVGARLRDNGSIALDLRATATELDGFERTDKPGSPAGKTPADAVTRGGKPMKIEGPVVPVFAVRNVKTQITLRPGETLVLQSTPRESFVFVTATLDTPPGQRLVP